MFVRSQAWLATSAAVFGVVACSDPNLPTDLRPDGPPEVLSVLVANNTDGLDEGATFCKTRGPNDGAQGAGDDKRPGLVDIGVDFFSDQICPEDLTMGVPELTNALPSTFYVRIMFDELLNGDQVETLSPVLDGSGNPTGNSSGSIATTLPVTFSCDGVAVPYDGYYQPAGNSFSWPLGPSLFIQAVDPTTIPTGANCTVSISPTVVVDKDGNAVPTDQLGPFTFSVSPLRVTKVAPKAGITDAAKRSSISPADPIVFTFNNGVDLTSFTASDVKLFKGVTADCTGGVQVPDAKVGFFQDAGADVDIYDKSSTGVNPDPTVPANTGNLFEPSTTYRLELAATASATDVAGGTGAITYPDDAMGNPVTVLCFDVAAM